MSSASRYATAENRKRLRVSTYFCGIDEVPESYAAMYSQRKKYLALIEKQILSVFIIDIESFNCYYCLIK